MPRRRLKVYSPQSPHLVARIRLQKTSSVPLAVASQQTLYYDVRGAGPSLVLTVTDGPRNSKEKLSPKMGFPDMKVSIKLGGLGISLVAPILRPAASPLDRAARGNAGKSPGATSPKSAVADVTSDSGEPLRGELVFLSVDRLSVTFRRSETQDHVEASVQEVQLDNQRDDGHHAVLLSRANRPGPGAGFAGLEAQGSEGMSEQPLVYLNISRRRPPHPALIHFDRVELLLRSIDLKIDAGFIVDLLNVARGLRGESPSSAPVVKVEDLDPLRAEVEKEGTKLHFEKLLLHKASVGLSFSGGSSLRPQDLGFWYRLIASLSSLDSSQLRLDDFRIEDTTLDSASLLTYARNHYYSQCLQELAWTVGSLEVLGNPRGLLRHVHKGCVDAWCEPYQGAMFSPEDMLEGLVLGTSSCVKNAFFGTFNSISKVAGATSQGCFLCLDEEPRRGSGQQPRHLGEGLSIGAASLARAIAHGAVGLCKQPARGFQAQGWRGLAFGAGRGLLGCLVEPVVGCLDLTRHTAEGIRNMSMASGEKRRRLPRMLYGAERVMRPYSHEDAELKALLVSHDSSLASSALVDCVRSSGPGSHVTAAILDSFFVHLDREKLLKVPLRDIAEVECSGQATSGQVVSLILHSAAASSTARTPLMLHGSDPHTLRAIAQMLGSALGAL